MKQAPASLKAAVVVGFILSYGALLWLCSFRPNHSIIADRLGYISAMFTALAMLGACWAAIFAHIVLKRNWPVRACRWAGVTLLIPCSVLLWEPTRGAYQPLVFIFSQAFWVSYVSRKLAFPEVSDEEAMRPEPLPTMFPK